MDKLFHRELIPAGDWSLAILILTAWIMAGWMLIRLLFHFLNRWTEKAHFQFSNMFVKSLPFPIYFLIIITGFMVSVHAAPFLDADVGVILHWLRIALFMALVYLADNVLQGLIRDLGKRHQGLKESHFLFSAFIHIAVWALGLMLVLDNLGISITPLLASLGVGSLAVALGFQSTFTNLFSGIFLLMDKPVRQGDYIKLSTGEEGTVERIGWRTTQIHTPNNHLVILPNSKLGENLIQNFTLPTPICGFSVEAGVDYESDLDQVEKMTLEVAQKIQTTIPGADPDFQPGIYFHDFGSYSINFTIVLQALNNDAIGPVKHSFIKALHERFRREKISMPFPIQSVELRNAPSEWTSKNRPS